jgi:hypothetical protein
MKNNSLENDFKYSLPIDETQDDDYEKLLEKDIESSCNFTKYIDKLELNDDLTDEELIKTKTKEEICEYKNNQILSLKAYITSLEQEKDDLIDNFKETTSQLLERLKDLESKNLENNFYNNNDNNSVDPFSISHQRPETPMIAKNLRKNNNNNINSNKKQRCPNCQKEFLESEFVAHSLQCLRHTFHCKKCGELVDEKFKKEHLQKFREPNKIILYIKEGKLNDFFMCIAHGFKINDILDNDKGDCSIHLICKNNRNDFLKKILNDKNINIDLNIQNKEKDTPLSICLNNKSLEMANMLLNKKVNIKTRNKSDLSPLMLSCKFGYLEIVKKILDMGGDINEKNILGETPLSIAQMYHHDELAMLILNKKQIKFKK